MALSMSVAIGQIRVIVAQVAGIVRTGSPAAIGSTGLPSAIPHGDFPLAVVLPGPDTGSGYILSGGQHRHTYEVHVNVLCNQGGDLAESAYQAMPLVDAIIERFVGNVTLGGRVNSCLYASQSGLVTLSYAGIDYPGWQIVLEVSEQAAATPAVGA